MIAHCAIVAAARKRVPAAQSPAAARNALGLGARRQRRRGDRERIVAPDVDLRPLRILRDDPLVLGQHRIDPARRGAAPAQLLGDAGEQAEPSLHAAEAARLQDPQDAGIVILGDRFGRQLARGGRRRGALGEARDQNAGARSAWRVHRPAGCCRRPTGRCGPCPSSPFPRSSPLALVRNRAAVCRDSAANSRLGSACGPRLRRYAGQRRTSMYSELRARQPAATLRGRHG